MSKLTQDHIHTFHKKGYTILQNALTLSELELLTDEADLLVNHYLSESVDIARELGCIIEPFRCELLDSAETDLYRVDPRAYRERRGSILSPDICDIVLDRVANWAATLLYLNDTSSRNRTFLLNEQYIIKPPKTRESAFVWHRDADYYHDASLKKELTVACWIALDDVHEGNGTLIIRDLETEGSQGHSNDTVVAVPAGSIVFTSSQVLHQSSGNSSACFRRVFMPQYSQRPFVPMTDGLAVPCNIHS